MPNTPANPEGTKLSFRQERFSRLSSPSPFASPLFDAGMADAVFSGGYYIILTAADAVGSSPRVTRAQQKRNRINEETLQFANLTRQMIETFGAHAASRHHAAEETTPKELIHHHGRHAHLLEDLQTLISKSDLIFNDHDHHLRHELDIARTQLLRGGSIDDSVLMQTLQDIAQLQGLSLAGTSVAGKFSAEIIAPPERGAEDSASAQPAHDDVSAFSSTPFSQDREAYLQREFDQFSAYDISEIGGFEQRSSLFFARHIMESLIAIAPPEPEQDAAEIAP